MAALYQHLLRQRSLYPVFPPSAAACVDFAHAAALQLPAGRPLPQLCVLPSLLAPGARVVPHLAAAASGPEDGAPFDTVAGKRMLCAALANVKYRTVKLQR